MYTVNFKEQNGDYIPFVEPESGATQAPPQNYSSGQTHQIRIPSTFIQATPEPVPLKPEPIANRDLDFMVEKSLLNIYQKEASKKIDLQKIEMSEKIRADIASKKSLQHFEILTGKSGEIFFRRQLFTEKIENRFPFSSPSAVFLVNAENQEEMVLRIKCRRNDGCDILLYLNPSRISQSSYLLRKFREKGMGLPFNRKKEIELLDCFMDFLLSCPIPKEICNVHLGWHIREGKLIYEMQIQNLWKEVSCYAL